MHVCDLVIYCIFPYHWVIIGALPVVVMKCENSKKNESHICNDFNVLTFEMEKGQSFYALEFPSVKGI